MSAQQLEPSPVRTAELLMDGARLSAIIGRHVHATHLRHKPGLSTVAALVEGDRPPGDQGDDVNHAVGWVQVCEAGHVDKLRNAVRRAGDRGRNVVARAVDDSGLWVLFGDLSTDPRLARGYDEFSEAFGSWSAAVDDATLVRYNPFRRILVRKPDAQGDDRDVLVRITAEKDETGQALLRRLHREGVAVLRPLRGAGMPASGRVRVWPWFGDGDLGRVAATDAQRAAAAAYRAGGELARLHRISPPGPRTDRQDGTLELAEQLRAIEESLAWWGTELGERAEQVRRNVETALATVGHADTDRGLIHGDFSADQVLLDGTEQIALIDFDRAGVGAFAADLGSWAATEWDNDVAQPSTGAARIGELALLTALLRGYRAADGPGATDEETIRVWAARSMFLTVTDPLRAGASQWHDAVAARLDQVEVMLP